MTKAVEFLFDFGSPTSYLAYKQLPKIKAPTMVFAGKQDAGTTPEMNQYIKDHVPGADITWFDAAHIANIECEAEYTDKMVRFLTAR